MSAHRRENGHSAGLKRYFVDRQCARKFRGRGPVAARIAIADNHPHGDVSTKIKAVILERYTRAGGYWISTDSKKRFCANYPAATACTA